MRRTSSEMRVLVSSYSKYTGLKREFCELHNLNAHTLDYWRRKFENENRSSPSGEFVPLSISPSVSSEESYKGVYQFYFSGEIRMELPASTPVSVLQTLVETMMKCSV